MAASVLCGTMWLGDSAALARQSSLPCALAAKQTLDGADETRIRAFITQNLDEWKRDDANASAKARANLLEPLNCKEISFAFRLKYGESLVPALTTYVGGSDEQRSASAAIMLGRVRTGSAADALTSGLSAKSPATRLASASGYRELLRQVSKDAFGFPDASIDRIFDGLASALTSETDPFVADILVASLGDATRENPALRGRAMPRLAAAAAERLRTLASQTTGTPSDWSIMTLRALDLTRQTMFEQSGTGTVDRELARRSALLAGHVLAYVQNRIASRTAQGDSILAQAVAASEGLALIAHQTLTGERLAEKGLERAYSASQSGNDASAFSQAAQQWIGAEGLLTKAPYNAKPTDFSVRP